jgi:hypothetical protein
MITTTAVVANHVIIVVVRRIVNMIVNRVAPIALPIVRDVNAENAIIINHITVKDVDVENVINGISIPKESPNAKRREEESIVYL